MNAAAVFRRRRLLSPAARLGPRGGPRSFERLRPVPYESRVAIWGAAMRYTRFIWYGSEALEAPGHAAGIKTRGGRKEALPPKNGRCVHFSSMPVLNNTSNPSRWFILKIANQSLWEGLACLNQFFSRTVDRLVKRNWRSPARIGGPTWSDP